MTQASGSTTDSPQLDGVRVLVVDDSIDHQMFMRRCLTRVGMQASGASTAVEAMASLGGVDLVLLDYRLPGTSGIELLDQIQQRPNPPSVIMVTGIGSIDVAVAAMRGGAVDFVPKDHGYLDTLPDVMRRAWRNHDLARRAAEMQRLALLVSSATDRDELFREIVSGAKRLLRATSVVLLLSLGDGLEPVSALGPRPADLDEVRLTPLQPGAVAPQVESGRLLVPLPHDDESVGLLAVWDGGLGFSDTEQELAHAFASFVGMALRNLRQRELEANLMSELRQTVEARRDFISSVSHELRTPLTSIMGFTTVMREQWHELTQAQVVDFLDRTGRNATELCTLVEELISLAELERGGVLGADVGTVQLRTEVEQVASNMSALLRDRLLTIDIPVIAITADPELVRRVVTNLLTNALKFSPDRSPIEIRAIASEAPDGVVVLEVVDHGIGLQPREAARVFDPFFRSAGSGANAVRGLGIGLALVREYVAAMGGTVGVRSAPGQGSTFWLTLRPATVGAARTPCRGSPGTSAVDTA
jgi:signal transduction histidine kinase/FixJ family two-component response regulator